MKNLRLFVLRPEPRSSATIDDLQGVLFSDTAPPPPDVAINEQDTVDPKVKGVLNICWMVMRNKINEKLRYQLILCY